MTRRRTIWISIAGLLVLIVGFWFVSGPPGLVDLLGYEESEPGVIQVALLCHNEVTGHFTFEVGESIWVFARGSDPDRYSFGRDGCLSSGSIGLGVPIEGRRLIDGFDFSTLRPLP